MNGPYRHYAEWSKSNIERQILYEPSVTKQQQQQQQQKLILKEIRFVVARGGEWGQGNWMPVVKSYKLPVLE